MEKYCKVEDFHYVASNLNPADLATRGNVSAADLGDHHSAAAVLLLPPKEAAAASAVRRVNSGSSVNS